MRSKDARSLRGFSSGLVVALIFALLVLLAPHAAQAQTPIRINFQPASEPVPSGYVVDTGLVYGARGNGLTYGWKSDNTALARVRGMNSDARYDTLTHIVRVTSGSVVNTNSWELALANGTYDVRVVLGDAKYYETMYALVEGQVVQGTATTTSPWVDRTIRVMITDGRLTLGYDLAHASGSTKICFIEVSAATTATLVQPTATKVPATATTVQPTGTKVPAPSTPVPGGKLNVARWGVGEIVLTAQNIYSKPYVDVVVTATFSGPGGVKKIVKGFWDGGQTFRVRFAPDTDVGTTWTYSISSNPSDPGLNTSGIIQVTTSASANHGFLRRDSANMSSFVFDDGTRYFMMGQTSYEFVRSALGGIAWKTSVVNTKANGMNKIRLLLIPWGGLSADAKGSFPEAFPFAHTLNSSGTPVLNHSQPNLAYWKKLDEIVAYMQSQGMIADLILFADSDYAFGTQSEDERYLRYALARYAAYSNVTWCLTNEWEYTGKTETYWNGIGSIVRNEDAWMTNGNQRRALSIHNKTSGATGGVFSTSFLSSGWSNHIVIQWGVRNATYSKGDQWGNASILKNSGKGYPVVNDEYGYLGEVNGSITMDRIANRNAIWGISTAGGYGTSGNTALVTDHAWRSGEWNDPGAAYDDIKIMVNFWTTRGIPYWQMKSMNSLVPSWSNSKRVYVLGKTGEYVVYAATGGTVQLTLPAGTFQLTRFDPRTGNATMLADVKGGSTVSLSLPSSGEGNDWVLHLKAR